MAKVKQKGYAQRSKQLDDINIQATDQCEEIVQSILNDVDRNCTKDHANLKSKFSTFEEFQHLPYMEMLDAIACQLKGSKLRDKHTPQAAPTVPSSPKRVAAPKAAEPRTLRKRAGKKQFAPAPTPAVRALTGIGYNVTSVRNFQVEVDLPDGSKRILTNEDFATMNLDDFRGTELERLLAETLRLPHMR